MGANFNFNKVIIGGRLTADPELKTTPNGISVASFTVAVNRRNQKDGAADFFNVTAWRQTAEFVCRYFRKASSICVVGSLQTRNWTDQQGNKRTVYELVADEAHFVDNKSDAPEAVRVAADERAADFVPNYGAGAPRFEELADDEDLPF